MWGHIMLCSYVCMCMCDQPLCHVFFHNVVLTLQTYDELKMFNSVVESFSLNYASALQMSKRVTSFREAVNDFAGYDVVGSIQTYQVTNK